MTDAPLDFEKVELVRERLALTIKDMTTLIGVSRVTYYKWVRGGGIREHHRQKVKAVLRQLLHLVKNGSWPPLGAKYQEPEARMKALLELLGSSE